MFLSFFLHTLDNVQYSNKHGYTAFLVVRCANVTIQSTYAGALKIHVTITACLSSPYRRLLTVHWYSGLSTVLSAYTIADRRNIRGEGEGWTKWPHLIHTLPLFSDAASRYVTLWTRKYKGTYVFPRAFGRSVKRFKVDFLENEARY